MSYMKPYLKYIMFNPSNKAVVTCTEKFLAHWLARGFEVQEIVEDTEPLANLTEED